jgi:hypothetical protein
MESLRFTIIQVIKILLISVCLFVSATYAQTEAFVICYQKQVWLVYDQQVVKLGKCQDRLWISNLEFSDSVVESANLKLSNRKSKVEQLIKQTENGYFEEIELSRTKLKNILAKTLKTEKIILRRADIPPQLQAFFQLDITVLIITEGARIGDRYEELMRYTIKMEERNPTLAAILEEVKKETRRRFTGTKDEWILDYPPTTLEIFKTQQKLDPTKTIADYKIKNGTVLRPVAAKR